MKKFSKEGRFESGLDALIAGKLWAFVPVVCKHGIGLGVAIANEPGYLPVPFSWANADTWDEMQAHADELNTAEGKEPRNAELIVASSMAAGKIKETKPRAEYRGPDRVRGI